MEYIDDRALVVGLKQSHEDAQEYLLVKYQNVLIGFIISHFQVNVADAEDIAIDTLYKAILKIDSFDFRGDNPNSFRNWLFQIARNIFYDQKRLELELQPLDDETLFVLTEHENDEETSDSVMAVREALTTLPDSQRVTLILHFSGWQLAEIAKYMETSPGTVRQWKARGLKAVAELLENHPVIQNMLRKHQSRIGESK